MNLRQLKYFIAVAEEGNIGRAAHRLNLSQPPLTRQIKQLESSLGVELFLRTPKGVDLTNAGAFLLKEAQNIIELIHLTEERTLKASQGEFGRLDVAIFGSAILDYIPTVILRFRDRYPNVEVALHTMSKGEQIVALRRRIIDIGFNRMLSPQPDLVSEKILDERLLLAVNSNNPLAGHDKVAFSEIRNHPLIMFPKHARPGFIDKINRLCHASGFSPTIAQEVGDAVTAVALVASGFGVCLAPVSATTLSLPGVVFKELEGAPDNAFVDLSCIYRADDRSSILQRFLEIVRQTDGG